MMVLMTIPNTHYTSKAHKNPATLFWLWLFHYYSYNMLWRKTTHSSVLHAIFFRGVIIIIKTCVYHIMTCVYIMLPPPGMMACQGIIADTHWIWYKHQRFSFLVISILCLCMYRRGCCMVHHHHHHHQPPSCYQYTYNKHVHNGS